MIKHCLDRIVASGIHDIVVVLGGHGELILPVIRGPSVRIVFNNNAKSEMAESVRIGLRSIDNASSGVLISLADHPLVRSDTFRLIMNSHCDEPDKIIIPVYRMNRGHPSLFPRLLIDEIFTGLNLKEIIHQNAEKVKYINVSDEGTIFDVDTMEDYRRSQDASKGEN